MEPFLSLSLPPLSLSLKENSDLKLSGIRTVRDAVYRRRRGPYSALTTPLLFASAQPLSLSLLCFVFFSWRLIGLLLGWREEPSPAVFNRQWSVDTRWLVVSADEVGF